MPEWFQRNEEGYSVEDLTSKQLSYRSAALEKGHSGGSEPRREVGQNELYSIQVDTGPLTATSLTKGEGCRWPIGLRERGIKKIEGAPPKNLILLNALNFYKLKILEETRHLNIIKSRATI